MCNCPALIIWSSGFNVNSLIANEKYISFCLSGLLGSYGRSAISRARSECAQMVAATMRRVGVYWPKECCDLLQQAFGHFVRMHGGGSPVGGPPVDAFVEIIQLPSRTRKCPLPLECTIRRLMAIAGIICICCILYLFIMSIERVCVWACVFLPICINMVIWLR